MSTQQILSAANEQYIKRLTIDLQLRGQSQNTQDAYLRNVRFFPGFCGKDADALDTSHVRTYLVQFIRSSKLCNASINQYNAAIRFFFAVTLNRTMNYLQMPMFKKCKTLPEMLSRDEIQQFIDECTNLKRKSWLMLAYGSGLRISEVAALRVKDIDSKAMAYLRPRRQGRQRPLHSTLARMSVRPARVLERLPSESGRLALPRNCQFTQSYLRNRDRTGIYRT